MFKKWTSILTVLLMLVSMLCAVTVVSADPEGAYLALEIPAETTADSEITVEVKLFNNPGTSGLLLDLVYDDAVMTLVDAAVGDLAGNDWLVVSGELSPHSVSLAGVTDMVGDGTVAYLTFKIEENAVPGTYSLGVNAADATDSQVQAYTIAPASGNFTVLDYVWADADKDGTPGIPDALAILQWKVGLIPDSALNMKAADADRSGDVGIPDALMILQWKVGLVGWDPNGQA